MRSGTAGPVLIFAPGTFSHENKGDAALLESFRDLLARHLGRPVALRLPSTRPDLDRSRYPDVVRMPLDPHGPVARVIHRLGRLLHPALPGYLAAMQLLAFESILPLLGRGNHPRFGRLVPAGVREAWAAVASAELVALVPGGYLMAPEPAADLWLYHASSIVLGRHLDRRIVVFPGSYGPFVGVHRPMARHVLGQCDWIMAREVMSMRLLERMTLRHPVVDLVPDAAFAFLDDGRGESELVGLECLHGPDLLVGMSVKPHHFPGLPDADRRFGGYLAAMAAAADHVWMTLGARVILVPQSVGSTGEDREVARRVRERMAHPEGAIIVDRELSPFGLSALYRRLDLMVGTRMHANILAMAQGVPAVAIAYEHKTAGIMTMAGLADLVVPIDGIAADPLVARIDDVWVRRSGIRAHLAEVVPDLTRRLDDGVARALAGATSVPPK